MFTHVDIFLNDSLAHTLFFFPAATTCLIYFYVIFHPWALLIEFPVWKMNVPLFFSFSPTFTIPSAHLISILPSSKDIIVMLSFWIDKIFQLSHAVTELIFQFSSVTQSCPTLCDPMDCSTSGFPIHHQLPELAQTRVHWVNDAIKPSHPLLSPPPPAFNLSQHKGLFQWVSSSHQVAKVLEFQLQHQSIQWISRTDFL